MLLVVLALLALCVGPVLGPLLSRSRSVSSAIDGFVIITVGGLVGLHILPQSVGLGGAAALPLAALGLFFPAILHRFDARQSSAGARGGRAFVATTLLLLAAFAHAVLDGVALVAGREHHDEHSVPLLAIAVIVHRLPYALALWSVGRERLGLPRTLLVLAALAGGTIAGALAGDQLVNSSSEGALALLQAFAAGAILHVLLDGSPVNADAAPRWSLVGVGVGVATLAWLTLDHPILATAPTELDFAPALLAVALHAAPALLAAFAASAVASVVAARFSAPLIARGPFLLQAGSGVIAGALRSLCACTVVPLVEGLIRRRASVVAAVAFLVAAPELSFPTLFLSMHLGGLPFALVRLGSALGIAIVVAVVVGALVPVDQRQTEGAVVIDAPPSVLTGLWRSVDHSAPWVLGGIVVAALGEALLSPALFTEIPAAIEVPLYALIGVPLYVCGQGATPIAAMLLHKGASVGAVVALLLTAPATNLATLGVLSRLLSRRSALLFSALVFCCASTAGVILNAVNVDVDFSWLHDSVSVGPSLFHEVCLALLLLLLFLSVRRQGIRTFLGQIVHPLDDAKGGHLHGPHCGHSEHRSPGFLKRAPVATVKLDFDP